MNKTALKRLYKKTYDECLANLMHYGGTEEHLLERKPTLDRILTAQTLPDAELLAKKAIGSIEMYALGLWSKRKIPGPNTPLSIETKAKKAESLARYLDKRAEDKHSTPEEAERFRANAEKQRKRAEHLYEEAEKARLPLKEEPCPPETTTNPVEVSDGSTVKARGSRATKTSRRSSVTRRTASSRRRS